MYLNVIAHMEIFDSINHTDCDCLPWLRSVRSVSDIKLNCMSSRPICSYFPSEMIKVMRVNFNISLFEWSFWPLGSWEKTVPAPVLSLLLKNLYLHISVRPSLSLDIESSPPFSSLFKSFQPFTQRVHFI